MERNKRKLKAALSTLPAFPGAPLPYRILQQAGSPLVDASSIAFQNELALRRLVAIENQLEMNRQMAADVQPISIPRELLQAGAESTMVLEELLESLPKEALVDDEAVKAVLADIKTGRDVIRESRQFSRANIVGGINLENRPSMKRTRKKTKTDKKMSKALMLANERFRKKNGSLRKGATQSKIMKYAHKLLRKM